MITIQTSDYLYTPVKAEGITLESGRSGGPARLTFRAVNDTVLSFHEGDTVTLYCGADVIFTGFVFSKRRAFGGVITVTAYDQIRYLKNRDIYAYEGLTATGLLSQIAGDWGLNCGVLTETGYVLPDRIENGRPLLDMIQTALDITRKQTGEVFVFYDQAGALRLSHISEMAVDTLLHAGSIGNFDYTSTIDRDAYSAVRLYRTGSDEGETVFHEARREDLIRRWGMLRHFARLEEEAHGPETAEQLMGVYGRKTRLLRLTDVVGDRRVRGGSMLPVELNLGDIIVTRFLMAERVVHRISEQAHTMELTLVGGDFVE